MAKWLLNRITTEFPPAGLPRSVSPDEPPVPPPRSSPPGSPRHRRVWLIAGLVAMTILGLVVWALFSRKSQDSAAEVNGVPTVTAKVERRDFVRTLRLNGIVEATQSKPIAAPRLAGPGLGSLVITYLAPAGTRVQRGDPLVEFDRQNQIKIALDREAEYRDLVEQIKKKQADQAAALARDQTELKQAENAVEAATLEVKRNEIVSRIDAEKNQENLEEARARFKQLRETFDLKRRAAQAELRILEIQRDRARNAMRHAQANSEKMAIRSPMDGLVVLNTLWKPGGMGEVQEGDEVRPGVPFLQVVNPSAMQLRVRVNQADVPYLRAGQSAQMRLDAYPDLAFPGRLERIAAIGVGGVFSRKMRTFVATFSVQGSDPQLMPDLSAAVDVELERVPGALVAPRDAVWTENGQSYIRVERSGGFEKRAVKIRAMSDTEVVIDSGIDTGAVVLRTASGSSREAKMAGSGS